MGRILRIGIGLRIGYSVGFILTPVFGCIGTVGIHMRGALHIRGIGTAALRSVHAPVGSVALTKTLTDSLRLGSTPSFTGPLCHTLRIGLTYRGTNGMSLGLCNAHRLSVGIRNTLIPTGTLGLADALSVALRGTLCDTLCCCITFTAGNTNRFGIAVAGSLSNRIADACRFAPAFRSIGTGCLGVGIGIGSVDYENTATDALGLTNRFGRAPTTASVHRCALIAALGYSNTVVLTYGLGLCHVCSLTHAFGNRG